MGKFINPFTDFGFKHIFGREMDKDILIEFLNDLLKGEHTIMDLRIMNNERLPETEQGRKVIFDIHCETDKGERIIIEMQNREQPRFNKEEDECETDFERWIYVLKHMDTLDRMPFKARKAIFERLERIGSMANLTPKQRAQYEAEWKMYNDYYNTLDFAVEKGMKKGMEEGMEKGLQKGLQEGLQEGLQKGKESTARNMKAEGITPLIIQKCTGLSLEEIERL